MVVFVFICCWRSVSRSWEAEGRPSVCEVLDQLEMGKLDSGTLLVVSRYSKSTCRGVASRLFVVEKKSSDFEEARKFAVK